MSEQVIQEGLLDDVPLVDLVVAALCAAGPARLELVRDGNSRAFTFADRMLVLVETSGGAQSLVKMLLKRKKLSEADAEVLINEAVATEDHIIEVVARTAAIRHSDLERECALWSTLLLVQSTGWRSGTYRILSAPTPAPIAGIPLDICVPGALIKGVYKRMDLGDIEELIAPYGDAVPTLNPAPPFSTMDLDLNADQMGFLSSIDGRRNIEEMLQFSSLSVDDTRRMLYVLHRLGIISFEDALQESESAHTSHTRQAERMPGPEADPIDMSSIRFNRGASTGERSATFHSASPHSKESISSGTSGPIQVEVGRAHRDQGGPTVPLDREMSLSGLFDDLDLEPSPTPLPQQAPPPPQAAPPSTPASPVPDGTDGDLPPKGAGPVIPLESWQRLSSKEKDRIRQLRAELNRLEKSDYFQFFAGSHESTDASIKKAFFGAAKRYHPDALLDDSDVYRLLAEALFSQFSEAWETLSDPELRDSYTRKHIFGEKDENDVAMEQVQRILDAEGSFKNGMRLLNAGKLQDALRHFKRAHDDYAEEGEYLAYYAFTLFRATRASDPTRADEALGMMKEAIALSPNSLKPYHLLGKAHLLKGDGKEAKGYLRKVLKRKPDDADALRDYRRADTLEGGGDSSGSGGVTDGKKGGGFFSRFGRKKTVSPTRKSEEQRFLDNLDLDR